MIDPWLKNEKTEYLHKINQRPKHLTTYLENISSTMGYLQNYDDVSNKNRKHELKTSMKY